MNDTAKQLEAEPTEDTAKTTDEVIVELSPEELEAKDAGWSPDKQDKDGNSLTAHEFMSRKPLFNKIHNMKDDIAGLRGDMKKMTKFFIDEKAKDDAKHVNELKAARDEALTNLDVEEVRKLDKKIEDVKPAQAEPTDSDWEKPYMQFVKENKWYGENPALKSVADIMAKHYIDNNPNSTPTDLYEYVANEMKKDYAIDINDNTDKVESRQSKVSGSTRRASTRQTKKQVVLSDLPSEEQRVVEVMAKAVGKTTDEYLKNYEL